MESTDAFCLTFDGKPIAILRKPEFYEHRKVERCARTFGFVDPRHPTVKLIMDSGDWLVGGDLEVFEPIKYNDGLDEYRLTPLQLRQKFYNMKV